MESKLSKFTLICLVLGVPMLPLKGSLESMLREATKVLDRSCLRTSIRTY